MPFRVLDERADAFLALPDAPEFFEERGVNEWLRLLYGLKIERGMLLDGSFEGIWRERQDLNTWLLQKDLLICDDKNIYIGFLSLLFSGMGAIDTYGKDILEIGLKQVENALLDAGLLRENDDDLLAEPGLRHPDRAAVAGLHDGLHELLLD